MRKYKNTWQKRDTKLAEMGITYQEYLASEHWKELKDRFRKSGFHRGKCNVCGDKNNINIHHKTYKRLGHEWLMDLIELCGGCHKLAHKADRNKTSQNHNLWNAHKRVKNL